MTSAKPAPRRRLYLMRHGSVSYFTPDGKPVPPDTVPLNETGIAQAYLKGTLSRFIAEGGRKRGFPAEKITQFDDPGAAVADLKRTLAAGDWILIKGSRRMKMEAVAEAIIAAFDLKAQTV